VANIESNFTMISSYTRNTSNKLRIGFLTAQNPKDLRAWSGIIHHLATSLARHAGEVVLLGPAFTGREDQLLRLDNKIRNYFGKKYDVSHSIYQSMGYAGIFDFRLQNNLVDVIFAPVASTEIALLKTSIPIVYMSDTTFAAINGYYADFSNLLAISRIEANFIERLAIRKAAHLIYPSQWAANSAIRDYGASQDRVHVFPMGANIDDPPSAKHIAIRQRSERIRLLFVGVDWERKGGPVAFETLRILEQLGIPATLTIIGCVPPTEFSHPAMTVIPFLNKNIPSERKQLADYYLNSDIFILPTRAECMGVVFCEAAAFGLPSFASETGGIPSVIENERTGRLFPLDANGQDYAKAIVELWRDPARLDKMVSASRDHYESQLNWDAWGKRTANVIRVAAGITDHPTEKHI
jgi:glycosyltransferase involved in cell wall biosynthesis